MDISEKSLFTEIRGNKLCLLEGIDRLISFGEKEISLQVGDATITVIGELLTLDCLSGNRLGIKGNIFKIEFGELNEE